jgi:hypothetical protein
VLKALISLGLKQTDAEVYVFLAAKDSSNLLIWNNVDALLLLVNWCSNPFPGAVFSSDF